MLRIINLSRRKVTGSRYLSTPERWQELMGKVMKVLFYTSLAVVGWRALRYFSGRFLAAGDLEAEQSYSRARREQRRATERWENEGGAPRAEKNNQSRASRKKGGRK